MGGVFRLDPSRLEALAADVRLAKDGECQAALAGLARVARDLNAVWTSQAQRRFDDLFGNWIGQLEGLALDLLKIETYLRACATEYRRLDAQRAGALDEPSTRSPRPSATLTAGGSPGYEVQLGDTLWAIAQRFGVTVDALRRANGLTGDLLIPGQVLHLPADDTVLDPDHGQDPPEGQYLTIEVWPGDTLSAIAQRYGVTVAALMQANSLNDTRIDAGQGLHVPRAPETVRGDSPPDLIWAPQAGTALSAEQIERAEAAVDQLHRAPLDFIPAYLDPGLRGETFAALDDYVRYGQVGPGVGVGTLIWQAVGERHGDVMANLLQQAHAAAEREPGSIMAASGAGDALVLSGPGVIDLHRAWMLALPEPLELDLAASDGALTVRGDTLSFTLSTARGPYTLVLHVTDYGVPVVIERGVPGQHDSP
jgi:LysM repeat protein/uncharacterized protein YukE